MKKYIDKDALIAEIKKRRDKNARNKLNLAASFEDNYLLSFIDTLEVKEEKEPVDVFIEKACKLLERMIWEVTYKDLEGNSVQHYDKMEFIEDFKNYMKGE